MRTKHAREIRKGILLARQVARKERVGPKATGRVVTTLPLYLQVYYIYRLRVLQHRNRKLSESGRKPPTGGSGASDALDTGQTE
jgi:hypothetical protein